MQNSVYKFLRFSFLYMLKFCDKNLGSSYVDFFFMGVEFL